MSKTESALTTRTLTKEKMAMALLGIDTTGLSDEELEVLAQAVLQGIEDTKEGLEFRPPRYKINKDTQTFTDPFGQPHDELRGVVIFKQRIRGHWKRRGEKVPTCSSLDGIVGTWNDKETAPPPCFKADAHGIYRCNCKTCPLAQWGTATDEAGHATAGQACKSMRRIYLTETGAEYPTLLTLPPTSVGPWDTYVSARLAQKPPLPDIVAETILRLVPSKAKGSDFTFSVIQPKVGARFKALEILQYSKMQQAAKEIVAGLGVGEEDYGAEEATSNEPWSQ